MTIGVICDKNNIFVSLHKKSFFCIYTIYLLQEQAQKLKYQQRALLYSIVALSLIRNILQTSSYLFPIQCIQNIPFLHSSIITHHFFLHFRR